MPRIVLAEANTHRAWSRNSASSRAIPVEKMLTRVVEQPYIPEEWGRNGKGMQAHGDLPEEAWEECERLWLLARDQAVDVAKKLAHVGVHKQTTNRLLEPFMWHTIIVTATEWSNFFHLRCHEAAHPAIRRTAEAARAAMEESTPTPLSYDEWHLPYTDEHDTDLLLVDRVKVSAARCARVSYLTHDGRRDVEADLALYDRLLAPGHMSPFEHPARPMTRDDVCAKLLSFTGVTAVDFPTLNPAEHFAGNFRGWIQHRKGIPGEADILGYRERGTL